MITKEQIDEAVEIASQIRIGINNNTITTSSLPDKIKDLQKSYNGKHGGSPNVIFRKELLSIYSKHTINLKIDNFQQPFTSASPGKPANTHCWSTLFLEVPKGEGRGVYSLGIQLYILLNEGGIKFGIGYGSDVDHRFIRAVLDNDDIINKIIQSVNLNPDLKLYNSQPGSPAVPNISSAIPINNKADLLKNWGANSTLVGVYGKGSVPGNAGKNIETILNNLCDIFNEICNKIQPPQAPLSKTSKTIVEKKGDKIQNLESSDHVEFSPKNLILYSPPGTGKTYTTIEKAIAIANPTFIFPSTSDKIKDREQIKKEFDRLILNEQIFFTTFHQSLSYEDFIEGIKPLVNKKEGGQVTYKVVDGIFKSIALSARKTKRKTVNIDGDVKELTKELFTDLYEEFVETLVDANNVDSNCILKTQEGNEFGLFKNSAYSICVKAGKKKTKMSASCEELVNVLFNNKTPTYKSYENKIIEKILEGLEYAEHASDNTKKNFVLIIDEINRGNFSQIFGELITLIEEDKRIGKTEALRALLPYSKEYFCVPQNLYVIGTMNTADRSVEALDTALRRRFSFEEIMPNPWLLTREVEGVKLKDLLIVINERIESLIDRDHIIGHSYFINVKDKSGLKLAFKNSIIPLLQEYFFGDYGKIGLVLGEGFVTLNKSNKVSFSKFKYDGKDEFTSAKYSLVPMDKNFDIIGALALLFEKETN